MRCDRKITVAVKIVFACEACLDENKNILDNFYFMQALGNCYAQYPGDTLH